MDNDFSFLFMLPGTTGILGVMKIYQLNENHQETNA
ncbi:Uncharacterised protein [Klebsiella pneumoniae]|nr:Uncharacterised protein [Klebsiella pneumoniae]